jgi:haloacid dehalogenase-like hydrolase
VETLSKLLQIPAAEFATIGDMPNDVLMFRKSGYSIAMGHADDYVKKSANTVTAGMDDQGFATGIENLLLWQSQLMGFANLDESLFRIGNYRANAARSATGLLSMKIACYFDRGRPPKPHSSGCGDIDRFCIITQKSPTAGTCLEILASLNRFLDALQCMMRQTSDRRPILLVSLCRPFMRHGRSSSIPVC